MEKVKFEYFKVFFNWLYDQDIKTKLNEEVLKYNSPITPLYVIGIFLRNKKLNTYLNTYLNSINLYYLDKYELFKFIKKCIIDYKVPRSQIGYKKYKNQTKLFKALRKKVPHLKNSDIVILCEKIEESDDKNIIYRSLGLEEVAKKQKISKKEKKKLERREKIDIVGLSLSEFLTETFSIIEI